VLRSFATGAEADDMHDDFKPQFKAQRSGAVEDIIRHDISTNKVLLYMKVRPLAPVAARLWHGARLWSTMHVACCCD
jgi:hypothetical protein